MRREVLPWLWSLLLAASPAGADDRAAVSLSREISPHWCTGGTARGVVVAAPGEVVALGELNLTGDAPSTTSGFRLRLSDDAVRPLHIDQGTLVREFGKLVFLRFYVALPVGVADAGGLSIEWGDNIQCANILVPAIEADPARRADYREIVFSPAIGAKSATEERQLGLKVVADRQSSRYRLLYLLPVVLVLSAALIRTIRARGSQRGSHG